MNAAPSNIEECEYWRRPSQGNPAEVGYCRLLQALTGVEDPEACEVKRDACEACCRSFQPSVDDLNPVIASLLHQLTHSIIERNGTTGCDAEKARELKQRAEDNVPILPPDEDDISIIDTEDLLATQPSPGEPIESLLPFPARRRDARISQWAVGITTAPRRLPTIAESITSVVQSGWPRPHLFIDSPVAVPDRFGHLRATLRQERVGAFPNYYLSLAELLFGAPDADAYMLVQDDVILFNHPGLREYLEQALWPGDRPGLVSLFCSRDHTQPQAGWDQHDGEWIGGTQAFLFPRSVAQAFIADRDVLMHRWNPKFKELANIGGLIGSWAHRNQIPVFYPTPSLAQHIGHVSTLWPTSRIGGARRADQFAGEQVAREQFSRKRKGGVDPPQ